MLYLEAVVKSRGSIELILFNGEHPKEKKVYPNINEAINSIRYSKNLTEDFLQLRKYSPPSITVNGEYENARKELVSAIDIYNERIKIRKNREELK